MEDVSIKRRNIKNRLIMQNQILEYQGNKISFLLGDGVMVNATQMAKPFNKTTKDWLRTNQTQDFINSLSAIRHIRPLELVRVNNGGKNPGTWMHEDVALEFARWLSPEFAIWCNDRIKELVKHGFTATPDKLEELANNPDLLIQLATQLKNERAEKERLAFANQKQAEALKESAPKVNYFNEVLDSKSTYVTNQIAKELGYSAVTLNRMLKDMGVQYKQNDTWLLYHKYQGKGYTKTKTYTYQSTEGETKTSMQTVWTEKGRLFIHNLITQSN